LDIIKSKSIAIFTVLDEFIILFLKRYRLLNLKYCTYWDALRGSAQRNIVNAISLNARNLLSKITFYTMNFTPAPYTGVQLVKK
jgi:hypothetical protein